MKKGSSASKSPKQRTQLSSAPCSSSSAPQSHRTLKAKASGVAGASEVPESLGSSVVGGLEDMQSGAGKDPEGSLSSSAGGKPKAHKKHEVHHAPEGSSSISPSPKATKQSKLSPKTLKPSQIKSKPKPKNLKAARPKLSPKRPKLARTSSAARSAKQAEESAASSKAHAVDLLSLLPKDLLCSKIWPEQRGLMGLKVAKWVRSSLQEGETSMLMVVKTSSKQLQECDVSGGYQRIIWKQLVRQDIQLWSKNWLIKMKADFCWDYSTQKMFAYFWTLTQIFEAMAKRELRFAELDFSGVDMQGHELHALAAVTSHATSLRIQKANCQGSALKAYKVNLAGLKELNLSYNVQHTLDLKNLLELLADCSQLEILSLAGGTMPDLQRLISIPHGFTTLKSLDLSASFILPEKLALFAEQDWISSLTSLRLADTMLESCEDELAQILTKCTALTDLDLGVNDLYCEEGDGEINNLRMSLLRLSSLQTLNLSSYDESLTNYHSTNWTFPICDLLRQNRNLKSLIFESPGVRGGPLLMSLQHHSGLTHLSCQQSNMIGAFQGLFLGIPFPSLTSLDLTESLMDYKGFKLLCNAMAKFAKLEEFRLFPCEFEGRQDLKPLVKLVERCRDNLTVFHFFDPNARAQVDKESTALVQALAKCSGLIELKLHISKISIPEAVLLRKCKLLKVFGYHCHIKLQGLKEIAEVLKCCPQLRVLDLVRIDKPNDAVDYSTHFALMGASKNCSQLIELSTDWSSDSAQFHHDSFSESEYDSDSESDGW